MKRSRFTEEQVVYALRRAEAGTSAGDICRQLGVAEATFYVQLLSDPATMQRYGQAGLKRVRERFALQTMTSQYQAVYQ